MEFEAYPNGPLVVEDLDRLSAPLISAACAEVRPQQPDPYTSQNFPIRPLSFPSRDPYPSQASVAVFCMPFMLLIGLDGMDRKLFN